MWPVLFTWRGIVLHSYHVMLYLALLLTLLLTVILAQRAGLNPDRTALAILLSYIPAFACARLLYAARHWDRFRHDPMLILRRSEGGVSLNGGIIGMFAGLFPLLWVLGLPAPPFFDALVLAMLAGIAVAKGGCILNGCCHGQETGHWCGVHLPDNHGIWRWRFPVQFMEMGWAVAVLLIMLVWRSFSPPPGTVAALTLVIHPAGRIILQNLRDEGADENAAVRKTCMVLIAVALTAGLFIWL
jgi:phosphatidylglycerol:prolipoprotein diacylglycerol transferase